MLLRLHRYKSLTKQNYILLIPRCIDASFNTLIYIYMKSSDAKASKCHLKFFSRMIIFIKLVYLSSVISLKLQ